MEGRDVREQSSDESSGSSATDAPSPPTEPADVSAPGPHLLAGEDLVRSHEPAGRDDGTCAFTFDPDEWEERTGWPSPLADEGIGVWRCPHEPDQGDDYCVFHKPLGEKEPGAAKEALLERVNETAETKHEKQFVGACFADLRIEARRISASDNFAIDLRHASVAGALALDDAVFDQPLELGAARLDDGTRISKTTFTSSVFARYTVFGGEVNIERSVFEARPVITNSRFADRADFRNTHFKQGGYFSRSVFDDHASFSKAQFFDNVTFYDAIFRDRFRVTRARFGREVGFIGATFHGSMDAALAEFERRARFEDATFRGEHADFENASFGDTVSFERAHIDVDRATFDGIEVGTVATFADVLVTAGEASFREARFDNAANFENAHIAAWKRVDLARATFNGEARFAGAELGAVELTVRNARFRTVADFAGATFLGIDRLSFDGIEVADRADFADATFHGPATFERARFRDAVDFRRATVADGGSFDVSRATLAGEADFSDATIGGLARFDDVQATGRAHFADADFEDVASFATATFEEAVDFSGACFAGPTSFSGTGFAARTDFSEAIFREGPSFEDTRFVYVSFRETGTDRSDVTVDLTDARIDAGVIRQPEEGVVRYDFREARLGEVKLRDAVNPAQGPHLDRYGFYETKFDGFDFSHHEPQLVEADWQIHRFDGGRDEVSPAGLERTYLHAKTGADDVGYSRGEGEFFVKEMKYRRSRLVDDGARLQRWTNSALGWLAGYGEKPGLVFLWSVFIVFAYAYLFLATRFFVDLANGASVVHALATATNAPGTLYDGVWGALLLSSQGFTTLVLGGGEVTNFWVRLVASTEGFLGAFMIALFLFALTKSIDR